MNIGFSGIFSFEHEVESSNAVITGNKCCFK